MKYINSWHLMHNEDVLRELSTDMYKGLTSEEAKRRKSKSEDNRVWRVKHASAKEIVLATLFDLATLLLVISAAAAAFFDKSYEAGAIVFILVLGAVLRTVAYVRANRILEGIAKEKIPVSSVIRDGRIRILSAGEIVVGDIIFLEEGDTVPCDGRVVSGEDSIVSENGITENKEPVHKFNTVIKTDSSGGEVPCEFRSNMLFAGSVVLSGAVRMVATACGNDALVSMKQGGIDIDPVDKLPIIEKVKNRNRNTSLIMLACVMMLTALSIFLGQGSEFTGVFLGSMAMAAAAMSEFLTTIGYIIVAVAIRDTAVGGSRNIKQIKNGKEAENASRAIIREPSKIDEIAIPDVMIFTSARFFKSGRAELLGYRNKHGYVDHKDTSVDRLASPEELLTLALSATAGVSVGMTAGGEGTVRISENAGIVSRAADAYSRRVGKALTYSYSPIDHSDGAGEIGGGIDTSIVLIDGKVWAVSCGGCDSVMKCCSAYETKDGIKPINEEFVQKIYSEVSKLEYSGARVVAVAKRQTNFTRLDKPALVTQYMTFVGFFAIAQEQEKEAGVTASEAAEYLIKNGVRPILFSETPDADLYYCHRLGLFGKRTVIIEYQDLKKYDFTRLGADGLIVSFERLGNSYLSTAYSKAVKYISREMKKYADDDGKDAPLISVVGMDVWDSGALNRADVGYAVVRSKYKNVPESLLKNAHAVVDTSHKQSENGFGGVIGVAKAIKAARRVIHNTDASKNYLTVSQSARLAMLLFAVLFDMPLISAVYILIWGLIYDFAAVLVMSFEQGDGGAIVKVKRMALYSVFNGFLWGGVTVALVPIMELVSKAVNGVSVITPEMELAVMAASAVISGVIVSAEVLKRGSIFRIGTLNFAQCIFALASIGFAAILAFTNAGASIVGGSACGVYGFFALVPGAVLLVVIELSKLFGKLLNAKRKT